LSREFRITRSHAIPAVRRLGEIDRLAFFDLEVSERVLRKNDAEGVSVFAEIEFDGLGDAWLRM
jgi:hypothetical protein